jgi:hypothetical protein
LAISAHVFPSSRISLSRCSSSGVHGVLVRLFLGGGGTPSGSVDTGKPAAAFKAPLAAASVIGVAAGAMCAVGATALAGLGIPLVE